MKPPVPHCTICQRRTERECAHVDCPNRREPTARPPSNPVVFPREGERTPRSYAPGDER